MRPVSTAKTLRIRSRCECSALVRQNRYTCALAQSAAARGARDATILLKNGVAPHVVSKRLGHASVAFTLQVYSWVLPGQQREAAEGFAAAIAAR
jgi:integrase